MTFLLLISVTLWNAVVSQNLSFTEDSHIQNNFTTQGPESDESTYTLDLQRLNYIDFVMLYNRQDCCLDSIIGVEIELLSRYDDILHTCGRITEARTDYKISCGNKMGWKVRVRHLKNEKLQFGKFDVFGKPVSGEVVLISRDKPTWQSSIYGPYTSSLAVDGKYKNNIFDKTYFRNCFHTHKDRMPFWTVDLQGTFSISHVVLYNRQDCCSERIIGGVVELLSDTGEVMHQCGQITDTKAIYGISCGNKSGQKVRVRGPPNQFLHLCEVEVFGEISANLISRGKRTSQSSAYLELDGSLAVDGNYENNMTKGGNGLRNCFHTNLEENPFFVVYLQGSFDIDRVVIYNRGDCCSERIIGATVELLNADGEISHECGRVTNARTSSITIWCGEKSAYAVRIRGAKHQPLQLCEVDVFGVNVPSNPSVVSRRKPTLQSSIYIALDSALAVDGKYDNYIIKTDPRGNCFHTQNDLMPFWTVNLQGTFSIDRVVLYNRMDCCASRIIGAVVELLSSNEKVEYECGRIVDLRSIYNISCGNMNAQMIRIRGASRQYLHVCEVDVFGDKIEDTGALISRGKPTTQSSVQFNMDGALAVDGRYENYMITGFTLNRNCFFTNNDESPFWTVDLQGTFSIGQVNLYNRMDCCSERIIGAVVELLSPDDTLVHECGRIVESKPFYSISCGQKVAGKVRVRGPANQYLHLCEVDVYGEKREQPQGQDIATGH